MSKKNTTNQKTGSPLLNTYWKNVFIATIIGLPLLITNLVLLHITQPYTSDDVIQQNIVQQWESEPRDAVVGEDTYVIKLPFYAAISNILPNTSFTLLITSICFLSIALIMLNAFQFLIHRDRTLGVLLSLLICSYGGIELLSLRTPNLRNLELPLAMLTAWLISNIVHKRIILDKVMLGMLILFAALEVVNDPYVLYVLFLPTMAVTYLVTNNRSILFRLIVVWSTVILLWKFLSKLISLMGLHQIPQIVSIEPSKFKSDSIWAIKGTLLLLGNVQIGSLRKSVIIDLILITALLGVASVIMWLKRHEVAKLYNKQPFMFWGIFYGFTIGIVCIVLYATSGMIAEYGNIRYLCILPFALIIVIAGLRGIGVKSVLIRVAILIIITTNTVFNLKAYYYAPPVDNFINFKAIESFSKLTHTPLGFADYWDANINTYYSKGDFIIHPIICNTGQISVMRWATNLHNYPVNLNQPKQFFIFVNSQRAQLSSEMAHTSTCSIDDYKLIFMNRIVKMRQTAEGNYLLLIHND